MPKKFFKRIMPDHDRLREHPHIARFGEWLSDPSLWHLNRHSAAGGIAIGVFWGFMPMIGQMLVAAAMAIYFRVNLPIAVLGVWISNPFTYLPMYLFSYKVGAMILEVPVRQNSFALNWQWLTTDFLLIWKPLLLGSLIVGACAAFLGYFLVKWIWRLSVARSWVARKLRRDAAD